MIKNTIEKQLVNYGGLKMDFP